MEQIETQELLEWFAVWKHDGLTPLTFIKGYAEFLLEYEESSVNLTDEQRESLEIIIRKALLAADRWNTPAKYLGWRYDQIRLKWEARQLAEIFEQALLFLNQNRGVELKEVSISIPAVLPSIRSNSALPDVIASLIYPEPPYYSLNYPAAIKATLQEDSKVLIQIHPPAKFDAYEKQNTSHWFYPGSALSVAKLAIERSYNEQIEVIPTDTGVEFRFSLPVWRLRPEIPLEVILTEGNSDETIELVQGQHLVVTCSGMSD